MGPVLRTQGDLALQLDRLAPPLREEFVNLLRMEIAEMRMRPGERVIERELGERTGVSRTTIREAQRQLSVEGLVTITPQKGTFVAVPSANAAADVYELRAPLEAIVARQFAERASDQRVRELREAFDEMEVCARRRVDPAQFLRAKGGSSACSSRGPAITPCVRFSRGSRRESR